MRGCSGRTPARRGRAAGRRARAGARGRRRCRPVRGRRARTARLDAGALERRVSASARGWKSSATSTITSPTSSMRPATCSRSRFSTAVSRRAQQQVGEVVGQDAVELLGHRAVERAHARLDVRDRDARLRGRERRRRASSSCRRRRARRRAARSPAAARARRACAPSARCSCRRGCRARARAAGRRAPRRTPCVSSSSWCWPVWTSSSSCSARSARETAAALTNCGRFPMTVTTRKPFARAAARELARAILRAAHASLVRVARQRAADGQPRPSIEWTGSTSRTVEARNASCTPASSSTAIGRSAMSHTVSRRRRVIESRTWSLERRRHERAAVERAEERGGRRLEDAAVRRDEQRLVGALGLGQARRRACSPPYDSDFTPSRIRVGA